MRNDPVRELKDLRGAEAPPETLDSGRIRLMAFMASHPMLRPEPALPWWRRALLWKPAVAAAMAATVVSGAGAVYAAGSSQPGESLYRVKLLTEEVRNRLTLNPETRFRVIAQQAEVRLDEAQLAMQKENVPSEIRDEQVRVAMENYQAHVAALTALAADIGKDGRNAPRAAEVAKTVGQVLARHELLVDSASTTSDEAVEASVVMPMQHALELEAHVMDALSAQAKLQQQVQDRADRMRKRWQQFEKNHPSTREAVTSASNSQPTHEGGEQESHEHPEEEAPSTPSLPAADGRIQVRVEAGQSMNIKTNDVENAVSNLR